ncbi:MAG: hypothetical protein JNL74_21200 [Fibrobacteres bacterium]|nr:hypothetical protein [Fibrobacterota bacterium]
MIIRKAIILIFAVVNFLFSAEGSDPLILNHADGFEYIDRGGVRIQRLTGRVSITYKGLLIKSDTVLNDASAGRLEFFNKVTMVDTTDRYLRANRLVYFKKSSTAEARGSIEVIDTSDKMTLTGDEGYYAKEGKITKITRKPVLQKLDSAGGDTLNITSKVMEHYGSLKKSIAMSSVVIRQGNMFAYCDRSEYMHKEGIITLFGNPRIEYEDDRIAGDTIHLYIENDTIREFRSVGKANALFLDSSATTRMNADTIVAFLKDRKVRQADLYGKAKTANFNSNDTAKVNTLAAKRIRFYIDKNAVDSMHAFSNAAAVYVHDDSGDRGRNETSGDSLYFYFKNKKIDRILAKGAIRGLYFGQ